ncbi:putative GTP pyrophosphokinase [Lachnospiraceae bacterium C7]|nr:putative GTP pyrophosphokinase [Lachnospiraceae bacterium C7]
METPYTLKEDVDSWKTVILLYNSALKEVGTKLEILNDEFQHVHQYNPIENIKSRIKSPESIVKKLKRYGYDVTIENMVNYVNDIAGIRLVCSFTSDIYRLAEMIGKQNDLTVISIKDYIKHPKESGYKSYHMIVTVPIFLSDRVVDTKVEIQIRTMAMDFWASLEHKIYYKFEGNAPEYISRDLRECSGIVSMLDAKMLQLNNAILEAKAQQEREEQEKKKEVRIAEKNAAEKKKDKGKNVDSDSDVKKNLDPSDLARFNASVETA